MDHPGATATDASGDARDESLRIVRDHRLLLRATPRATFVGDARTPGVDEVIAVVRLSATLAEVFELLDTPRHYHELAAALAERHALDADEVLAELAPMLDDLLARGLLRVVA